MYLLSITLTMPVLLGFVGLGSEAGYLLYDKQSLQAAADSAAASAATAYGSSGSETNTTITTVADAITAQYGFVNGTNGVTVIMNHPPLSGNYTGNSNAVEVIASQPQAPIFSSYWISQPFNVQARAVALLATGGDCVLALAPNASSPNASNGVLASGSADINMPTCGLFSDSNSTSSGNKDSILVTGSGSITAKSVGAVGTVTAPTGAITPTPTTGDGPTSNPYSGVEMPTYSGCNSTNYNPGANQTLTPVAGVYVFCGGNVNIGGGKTVTLQAGTYIVNGASFSVSGGGALTSAGAAVTLVFTNGATASISSTLNLTAPTSGPLSGLAIFEDPAATVSNSNKFSFTGGSNLRIVGAIDLPTAAVTYSGSSISNSPCTQLIANTIDFTGSASFANNCASAGTRTIGATAQLVE